MLNTGTSEVLREDLLEEPRYIVLSSMTHFKARFKYLGEIMGCGWHQGLRKLAAVLLRQDFDCL
jgi:hypothetical protein